MAAHPGPPAEDGEPGAGDRLEDLAAEGPPGRARAHLARQLGVPESALRGLDDAQAETAWGRWRELVERMIELRARAVNDDLTEVLRRGPGLDALRLELRRARRLGQPLSVAFVDVDGLKRVNDTGGHQAGDRLLRTVADTMRRRLRTTDVIVRHGGDEFVCVLPGADAEAAHQVMQEVARAVHDATGGVGVSFGVASIVPAAAEQHGALPDADPTALLEAADRDLYDRRSSRGGTEATRG